MTCVSSEIGEDFFLTNIKGSVFLDADEEARENVEELNLFTTFNLKNIPDDDNLLCSSVTLEHASNSSVSLVGLQVWRGALFLADFLIEQRELLKGKVVLELASGTGITAIVASAWAARVTATDVDRGDILPLLRRNCHLNSDWRCGKEVSVKELDFYWSDSAWSQELRNDIHDSQVILAADVVYDREITSQFFKTLVSILRTGEKIVFIAIERRLWTGENGAIIAPNYEFFLENLRTLEEGSPNENYTVTVSNVRTDFNKFFDYNRVNELYLWRIENRTKV